MAEQTSHFKSIRKVLNTELKGHQATSKRGQPRNLEGWPRDLKVRPTAQLQREDGHATSKRGRQRNFKERTATCWKDFKERLTTQLRREDGQATSKRGQPRNFEEKMATALLQREAEFQVKIMRIKISNDCSVHRSQLPPEKC